MNSMIIFFQVLIIVNSRFLQVQDTIKEVVLNEKELAFIKEQIYIDIKNPLLVKYKAKSIELIENNKPEAIFINKTITNEGLVINNKVSRSDYQYSGRYGLGNGVIAIIAFMIIGLLVCIFGISTEYSV